MDRRRKFWGWGYEDQRLTPGEERMIRAIGASQFKVTHFDETLAPNRSAS